MKFNFINGYKYWDNCVFPTLSFGIFISKLVMVYAGYDEEESTVLVAVLNFGIEFDFSRSVK